MKPLRYVSMMILAAALIARPALSNAAPRTIDDCEKIEAADAYNQCLATFGPVGHIHGLSTEARDDTVSDGGDGDSAAPADSASSRRHVARAHFRHHASRHAWARHAHAHHARAERRHEHGKRFAFTVISSHSKLR